MCTREAIGELPAPSKLIDKKAQSARSEFEAGPPWNFHEGTDVPEAGMALIGARSSEGCRSALIALFLQGEMSVWYGLESNLEVGGEEASWHAFVQGLPVET